MYMKFAFEVLDLENSISFETLDLDVAIHVSQTRVWRTLRLGYLASYILDAGLTPDRVQICTGQLRV